MFCSLGSTSIQDGSLLIKSLNDAQLFLHSGDSPHILGVDQATFIKVNIVGAINNK